jgi:maltokinase
MTVEARSGVVGETELLDFIRGQRWFGAHAAESTGLSLLDQAELCADPLLVDLLAEVRYGNGAHDVYHLLVGVDGRRDRSEPTIAGTEAFPALTDASAVSELLALMRSAASVPALEGNVEFCSRPGGIAQQPGSHAVRALALEQANSTVVVDERLVLKLYRRLEAGVNPELELLRFLGSHAFANAPELLGSWSYSGAAISATLGIAQRFLAGAVDGWSLAVDELPGRPEAFLRRAGRLGEVIGMMHRALASDAEDPAFAPEEASRETIALVSATVDDEIAQVFEHLPDSAAVAPIAGCGGAVRDLLQSLRTFGSAGRLMRLHGDLHLGQVLWTEGDWFVVDFEGDAARSLSERRAKRSPLRDVAGMLRSLTYAVTVAGRAGEPIEEQARASFLDSYLAVAEPAGVLPAHDRVERLLAIFELEKAVYELRYELAHRPDWVYVPVDGIRRLLERASR